MRINVNDERWATLMDEFKRAVQLHPAWPSDHYKAAAVMMEEAGEVARACLEYDKDRRTANLEKIREEVEQVAVVAIRYLENLPTKSDIQNLSRFD